MAKKQEETPRIIIAMPCTDGGSMKARTAHSVGAAIIGAKGLVIDFVLRLSCDIASSRTHLVKEAMKRGATHMLFVDCDMLFPSDVIPRLLAHKKAIVGVEYNKRELPLTPVFKPATERSETLYLAKYAGTGLMLIDLSIFVDLDGAWFNFGRDSEGALVIGEDAWFCNTARDAGHETWIDPTIKVGHLGDYIY